MRLFQILGNQVSIVKDKQYYTDTIENYLLDGGLIEKDGEEMTIVVHDSQQDYCEVNGVVLPYPNEFFETIINSIDTLLTKKSEREYIPPKPPTDAEIQAVLTQAVQSYLDSKAQERNYDNIHTACTYINSSDPIFASEASALLLWRDKVWRECYSILDDVKAGRRQIPSVSELLTELPAFSWPDEA